MKLSILNAEMFDNNGPKKFITSNHSLTNLTTSLMLISLISLFFQSITITASSSIQTPWYQVNQNGFGQPGSSSGTKMFVFDQSLYAYAGDYEYGLFRMQNAVDRVWKEVYTPVTTGVIFHPFGSHLCAYDLSNKQIWWIKEGEIFNSGNWKQATSNGLPGGISPVPMTIFNNKIYSVYYTSSGTFEIWRSADVGKTIMNWEVVVQNSFGDPVNNKGVDIIAIFNNHIYAGTQTRDPTGSFGDYYTFGDGIEIWESSSGNLGTWTQINYDGFGTEITINYPTVVTFRTNQDIGSWGVYQAPNQPQEYLYIGTLAHFGAQIWRYDGTGKNGWTDVSPIWAFDPIFASNSKRFTNMVVFQGSLYVTEGYPSAMLDKYDGTNWSIEVGESEPPFTPENNGLLSLAVVENKLYVGTLTQSGADIGDQVWGYPFPILPGAYSSTPALVCDGYETHMVVRGTDNGIYYMRTDYMGGGGWSGTWTKIPGSTCDEPALAIMGNDLHLVVRGMNNGLYHKIMNINTGVWGNWIPLGGSTTSAPTFITSTSNSLALAVRGSDDGVYYNSYVRVPLGGDLWLVMWTGWTNLQGATIDKPALASDGSTLTLAVRGKDNGIYLKTMDLSSGLWGGWLHFSGATSSPPAVEAEFMEDDFILAVRGMDNKIYYTYTWHGEWSGPWFNVPGLTIDMPLLAKTSIYGEVMHLVVRGADNGIYHTTDWSGWTKIPGTTTSCPGLTEYYYVGLELVYQDSSNRIWYDFWSSGSGW